MATCPFAEISWRNYDVTRPNTREFFKLEIRRENIRSHIKYLYGEEMLIKFRELDKLRNRKECLLASLAFLLRCRENRTIPTFAKVVHHVRSPAANRITRNASLALVRERIRYTRRRLDETSRKLIKLHLKMASSLFPVSWEWMDTVS